MRGSKPVCLLCRLKVTSKTRTVQWQTISTTSAKYDAATSKRGEATASTTTDTEVDHVPESNSNSDTTPQYVRRFALDPRRKKSNVLLSQPKTTREQPSSRVDALFQEILQEQQSTQNAKTRSVLAVGSNSMDLSLVRAIGRLQEMLDGSTTPVAEAYLYFRTEIHPAVQVPGIHVPQAYNKVKFALMEKVIAAKKADMFNLELPTVADIFRIYAEAGDLKPKQWCMIVGELIRCIITMKPIAVAPSISRLETEYPQRDAMLADLIESWKVLSLPNNAIAQTGENELTNGLWFPRLDKFALTQYARKGNFVAAFCTLFPQYPRHQLDAPFAVLAISTYTLLNDSTRCSIDARKDATRFMSKVAYLIKFVDLREHVLQKALHNTFPSLEKYVMGLWPRITAYLRTKNVSEEDASEVTAYLQTKSVTEEDASDVSTLNSTSVATRDNQAPRSFFNAASVGYRLSRAHGLRVSGELDRLWEEFVGTEATIPEERAAQIRQHPELIDSFINTRMEFNQPEKAIVAWGLLSKVGLKPSLRTWNLMLGGLRKAGNVDGIKNIWAKLVRSGLKLDTAIWTTRVAGLIQCGDIKGGLLALEEMASLWETDNKTAVKPTIEPVNAALTGLIRHKKLEAAEKLLAWAGSKGIQPDVYTFNTMLRPLVRDGNRHEDVEKLFAAMQNQGVQADEATFVIILDASFSKDCILEPDAQARIVADVAGAMAAAGLQLNMRVYGKMIYLLLRSNNTMGAMAVVNHIYNRNLELSPHIYTMLVEHCFAQDPPALDTVHLFVQRRRHLDYDDVDRVFYDRVIRGYALVGETQAALDAYRLVAASGVFLSLGTLSDLLRALLRQERLDDASYLVQTEKKRFEGQNRDPEENRRYWNHQFWQLARKYGLLKSQQSQVPSRGAEEGDSPAEVQDTRDN